MAARYISSRNKLYRKVLLAVMIVATGIFAFVYFFMVESVTISFNTGSSGIVVESVKIEQGKALGEDTYNLIMNIEAVKNRDGYNFSGWFYNGNPLQADTVFNRNAVIFAVWDPLKYEIIFDLNGGTYNTNLLNLEEYEGVRDFGTTFSMPPNDNDIFYQGNLSLDGKVLANWSIEKSGKTVNAGVNFTINSIADIQLIEPTPDIEEVQGTLTFKAEWKKQTVKVWFRRDADTTWVEEEFDKGTVIPSNKIPNTSNLSGWDGSWNGVEYKYLQFEGWYTDDALTNKVNLSTHLFNQNTILYANFAPKPYTVSFVLTGGEGSHITSQTVAYNERVIEPEPPTMEGYTFTGWWYGGYIYEDASGWHYTLDPKLYDFSKTLQGNFTGLTGGSEPKLYARWEEEMPAVFTDDINFNTEQARDVNNNIIPGEVRIIGMTTQGKALQEIVIPDTINNDRVTQIGSSVFTGVTNLVKVTILSNINYIAPDAFGDAPQLRNIKVYSTNPNYKDINGVLYSKDGTILIRYPSGRPETSYLVGRAGYNVNEINDYAFHEANHLVSIELNVERIGNNAFQGSTSLVNVILTDKVEWMGDYVFADCPNIANITVEVTSQHFVADQYALYTHGYETLLLLYNLTNENAAFTTRDQTIRIAKGAFKGVTLLTSINTNNVQVIEEQAFTSAINLSSITFGNSLTTIGMRAFWLCDALVEVTLPSSVVNYPDAYLDNPEAYGEHWFIFYECRSLQTINIYGSSTASVAYFTATDIEDYLNTNGIILITL